MTPQPPEPTAQTGPQGGARHPGQIGPYRILQVFGEGGHRPVSTGPGNLGETIRSRSSLRRRGLDQSIERSEHPEPVPRSAAPPGARPRHPAEDAGPGASLHRHHPQRAGHRRAPGGPVRRCGKAPRAGARPAPQNAGAQQLLHRAHPRRPSRPRARPAAIPRGGTAVPPGDGPVEGFREKRGRQHTITQGYVEMLRGLGRNRDAAALEATVR
jgi:hypothetical protein